MQNWLEDTVTEINMDPDRLPEVEIRSGFLDKDKSEIVLGVASKHKDQMLAALVHNSPFVPKEVEYQEKTFKTTIERDNRRIAKGITLAPTQSEEPEITIQLSDQPEYPDGLMIDAKSEALCSEQNDIHVQRIERFNSEGRLIGELRRLRIPINLAALPASVERFSSHLQIEAMIGFSKNSNESPAIGITVGGYSDLNNDAPLIFYGSSQNSQGKHKLNVFDESPMVENDPILANYLKGVALKYGSLITQRPITE